MALWTAKKFPSLYPPGSAETEKESNAAGLRRLNDFLKKNQYFTAEEAFVAAKAEGFHLLHNPRGQIQLACLSGIAPELDTYFTLEFSEGQFRVIEEI